MIKFNKLHEDAIIPTRATDGSAGYDLYAVSDGALGSYVCSVYTGVSVDMTQGLAGFIWPRSSMASKGVQVLGGLIDSDYKGEIIVMLTHLDAHLDGADYSVGDRIAQIVFQPVVVGDDKPRDKRTGGFGSTGK